MRDHRSEGEPCAPPSPITIAIPSLNMRWIRFTRMWLGTEIPKGGARWLDLPHEMAIDKARNAYARKYLAGDGKRLLMVDDDMVWHPGSVMRLWERDLDIVAGLTWTNQRPPVPTIWTKEEKKEDGRFLYTPAVLETYHWLKEHEYIFRSDDPVVLPQRDDDLVEVKVTGAAFILIKRHVLEAIDDPWFDGDPEDGFGEDFAFCRKARKAGFKVYVDRSVVVTHQPKGGFPIGPVTFMDFVESALYKQEERYESQSRRGEVCDPIVCEVGLGP